MLDLRYLETSKAGVAWMRAYYRKNPQLDLAKAVASLGRAEKTIREFPRTGKHFEDFEEVREYKIQNTAFSLLYTVARKTIWIIDVRDQRGFRSANALRIFAEELQQRHGIPSEKDT